MIVHPEAQELELQAEMEQEEYLETEIEQHHENILAELSQIEEEQISPKKPEPHLEINIEQNCQTDPEPHCENIFLEEPESLLQAGKQIWPPEPTSPLQLQIKELRTVLYVPHFHTCTYFG